MPQPVLNAFNSLHLVTEWKKTLDPTRSRRLCSEILRVILTNVPEEYAKTKMTPSNMMIVLFYKEKLFRDFLIIHNPARMRKKYHETHNIKIDHMDNFQKSFSSDHAAVKGNHVVHLSVFLYW